MRMLTQSQYQNAVYSASRANAVLIDNLRAKEALGFYPDWNLASCQQLKIKSGKWSLAIQDYSSDASVDIYNQLLDIGSTWMGGIVLDPNAQIPGTTIVTIPVLQNLNNDQLPINTTNDNPQFILSNYHANYYPLYGNNPFLAPYINAGGFNTGDEQTPPIITRVDPNDPSSDITQILFDYPVATLGYLNISGIGNISTGSPSSGGGVVPITFTYTQADLLLDNFGGYYLQLVLPGTKRPYYASLNGISISINYDKNTQRFSGFANNNTCVIEISLM